MDIGDYFFAFFLFDNYPALKTLVFDCTVYHPDLWIGSKMPEILDELYENWKGYFPVCSKNSTDFLLPTISPHIYTY